MVNKYMKRKHAFIYNQRNDIKNNSEIPFFIHTKGFIHIQKITQVTRVIPSISVEFTGK